ncbi:MAG: hypothetical protein ACE5E1_00940 [Phycisphaerae bacterium]
MTKTELLVDRLQVARRWTKDLLADIDEGEWFNMPTAGVGHVAWQVGHLASSQVALIHVRCFGRDYEQCLPRRFREAFGRGSTPVAAAMLRRSSGSAGFRTPIWAGRPAMSRIPSSTQRKARSPRRRCTKPFTQGKSRFSGAGPGRNH